MDPLEGVRLKLDRAENVIEELYEAVVAYLAENQYEVVGEFEPERSEYVLRGRVTESATGFGVVAGDVVHNLRSALDHLAWQLALLNTATPYDLTQFPIALTKGEFGSKRGQMIGDLTPKHRALVETFQPYNGTNKKWAPLALRDLRILSNTDKHRVLNATVARQITKPPTILAVSIVRDATEWRDARWFPDGPGRPIDGAELVRVTLIGVGPNPEMKTEGLLPVTISLDDPSLTRPYPNLVPQLRAILRAVGEVVSAFEPDLQPR